MNSTSAAVPDAAAPPAASDAPTTPGPTPDPTPRRGLRVISVVGPVVALMLATFVPFGLSELLLPPMADDTPAGTIALVVVAQSLVIGLAAIGLCAVLLRCHGLRLRDAGFRWTRVSLPSLMVGLVVGAGVLVAVGVPLTRLGLLRTGEQWSLPWWALIISGLAQAFLLQGLPEELLFRGYQMTTLRLRPVATLIVSASVFASLHLISQGGQENTLERILYLAMPFGFALAAGALVYLTDSLWAAVGVHAGMHVGGLIGVGLGIGDGPWLWATCGAVYALVAFAVLVVMHRRGRLTAIWRGPQH